jgi:hypothetical protein
MMQPECKWDKYVRWLILFTLFYLGCHVVVALLPI